MMDQFLLQLAKNKVWYGFFTHLRQAGIKHGISTRLGGRSDLPYASLNLGLHTGDDSAKVRLNRRKFCMAVGVDPAKVVTAEQVHGDAIAIVTADEAGRGARDYVDSLRGIDALVTNVPQLPLLLFFADCVPVLIADPVQRVIAVCHAGWKGTVANIAAKTLDVMQNHFATKAQDCLVGIAPSIGPCCYEVDETVIRRLQASFADWQELVMPHGPRWMLDLWEANRRQLLLGGVSPANIVVAGACTACNSDLFFSHRAEAGCTGRIGAVMML